jgi:uncharacterized protein
MNMAPAATARLQTIDTIRGIAVLGILVMNIIGFAFPGAAYLNPAYTGAGEPLNLPLWAVAAITFDGKMRALFAMLFGASVLLLSETGDPETRARRHGARMAVLFLIGMLHASLLWPGDILLPFAVVGMIVFSLRDQPVSRLVLLALVALSLQAALFVSFGFSALDAEARAALPGATAEAIAAWSSLRGVTYTPAADLAAETAAYRGSLADILAQRHQAVVFARVFVFPFIFFLETFGLMLLGMALFRTGWWQAERLRAHYRQVAVLTIGLGWAIGGLTAWLQWESGFAPATYYFTDAVRLFVAPAVALGYAAVTIMLVGSRLLPRLSARLAAAGRMALSNYLSASILCNLIFTGVGLGLYASLSRAEVMLVVLAIWALQLGWSKPWLERHAYGPAEWLWRSLSKWARQPWRRTPAS